MPSIVGAGLSVGAGFCFGEEVDPSIALTARVRCSCILTSSLNSSYFVIIEQPPLRLRSKKISLIMSVSISLIANCTKAVSFAISGGITASFSRAQVSVMVP